MPDPRDPRRPLRQPTDAQLLCTAGRQFLASTPLPPVDRGRVDAALRLIDDLSAEIKALGAELEAAFAGDARIARLVAIPGIGFTTAAIVLAEVGDAARFPSADRLCSWAGLAPTERSSDEHVRRGHFKIYERYA